MTFFLYENWRTKGNSVRVHRADCRFCNEGQGVQHDSGENGTWHGDFADLNAALDVARRRGGKVSRCQACLKG